MLCVKQAASFWLVSVCALVVCACGGAPAALRLSYASQVADPLTNYASTGEVSPVLDPSIMRQGSTYYSFSTDVDGFPSNGHLPIHCSQDEVNWTLCGSVFPGDIPAWVSTMVPGIHGLWAPDISYFNGLYHVYYCGSTLGSNRTVIGLATNTTLDGKDPAYKWVDRGLVFDSVPGNDFNALDPNILVDTDGSVWLTYGSYWNGIKQRQIDALTGLLASDSTVYDLATRPGVPHNPIEGASLIHYGQYYYLFVSIDYCCKATVTQDNYKEAVGRSSSAHGGFVGEDGTPMMQGGGTVLLQGDSHWNAPGGGTAYIDALTGESLLIFHAQDLNEGGTPYQWVEKLTWTNGWPVLGK
jgi:arabinan endo-1,5-alpha-L-arabinosidase